MWIEVTVLANRGWTNEEPDLRRREFLNTKNMERLYAVEGATRIETVRGQDLYVTETMDELRRLLDVAATRPPLANLKFVRVSQVPTPEFKAIPE